MNTKEINATKILDTLENVSVGKSQYLLSRQVNLRGRSLVFFDSLSELMESRLITYQNTFWRKKKTSGVHNPEFPLEIGAILATTKDSPPVIGNPMFIGPVWEPLFAQVLWERGLKIIQQYPAEGYALDIALVSKDYSIKLDVEVDGRTTHLNRQGRRKIRDVLRDSTLAQAGWRIKRFWVRDLMEDMDGCARQIETLWKEMLLEKEVINE